MAAGWQPVSLRAKLPETDRAATLRFATDGWPGHRAGQHVDVRLTAEDGYQAQRSYSIASPPEDDADVALTVERLDDGEVSPYLVDVMELGDTCELRGPIGGWFVWDAADGGPLLLVGGGSGLVPLMSMLRHRARIGARVPARLLLSARSVGDILYTDELRALDAGDDALDVTITLTRSAPPDWKGHTRRVDRVMLEGVAFAPSEHPLAYVCGPTPFVESVAESLVALGHDAGLVKTERFGATGS
ncbi:MAG TPA: ferredoxin reductase [Solirubrobacteraceae bacterium]|nr:ferredoxin reductase [Solirubrobacteraceae bacterium]